VRRIVSAARRASAHPATRAARSGSPAAAAMPAAIRTAALVLRPRVALQLTLCRHGRANRLVRRREHHEEAVALGPHLIAAARGHGGPHDRPVR